MKKYVARMLSCVLVLGMLCTVAMAAEQNVPSGTGSVTFSDVVSTETKTLTIDGEQKEVTIYYVSAGSTFQINSSDPDDFPGGTYYEEFDNAYTAAGGDQLSGNEAYTFEAEDFEYFPLCAYYTTRGAEKVFCMLNGQQGATPVAPADTTPTPAPTTPAGEATTAETVPAGPGTYTVVKYDTLGHIALNYYGSYKYHTALYNANAEAFKATGGALKPGMVLNLPDTLGTAKRIGMPVAGDGETLYTVKAGDTLGAIAKAAYGDVMKYQDIFARNSDRLTNANTIYEGQVIVLPAK